MNLKKLIQKTILFSAVFWLTLFALEYSSQKIILAGNNSVATSVIVGNSSPSFTAGPAESTASYDSSPSNVGTTVNFTATATDSNSESYYLAVCKGNTITPVNGNQPTCGVGSFCISTLTASGSPASCSYTTLQGDAETQNWYAFVCDNNASSSACSAYSQGTGNAGSPFIVNHPPTFSAIGVTTPVNVGQTVSWTTGVGTSDSDTVGGADTVKLVVCKTTGLSAGTCDGGASDRWCESSAVSGNPSCSIGTSSPWPDQVYNAYAYVVDSHNFGPTGGNQGSTQNYTVNNATPVISNISLNSNATISLPEAVGGGTTEPISMSATITDANGCSDITTVTASVYRSGVGFNTCDTPGEANGSNCYPVITCSTSNCGSGSDATYTCTANFKYYSDSTDVDSVYPTQTWKNTFVATDNNSAVGNGEHTTGVVVESTVALDVTNSISYGNLSAGQKNDPLDKTTTVTNLGNAGIDQDLSGTNMLKVGQTDVYIAVAEQKYALSTGTAYASGTSLSTTPATALIHLVKATSDVGTTRLTWWGLNVPNGTTAGTYSGTNTVTAKIGATNYW